MPSLHLRLTTRLRLCADKARGVNALLLFLRRGASFQLRGHRFERRVDALDGGRTRNRLEHAALSRNGVAQIRVG